MKGGDIMGIRGLVIMKINQYTVIAEYNGKETFRVLVTGVDARDALESAKVVLGNRYELRVIT
jgi:hypothetical protein